MNRSAFDPGPLAEVRAEPLDGRWTLVFIRDLHHPPSKVWAALTEPEQLRAWAPFEGDLRNLGDTTLTMIDGETAEEMAASVLRAEPPTLLEYSWGTDLLRWDLTPSDGGTRLVLRHRVEDREWLPKVAAGWHLCLVVAEHLLDGDPIPPIRGADAVHYGWDELNEAYGKDLL